MSSAAARLQAADVITFIDVRADAHASAARALTEQALQLQRTQPQSKVLLLEELDRPGHFVMLESTAGAATPLPASIDALLLAPPDRRSHTELVDSAAAQGRAVSSVGGAAHLYVIAHVDLFSPINAEALHVLTALALAARAAAGNLAFEVWQQSGYPNHFDLLSAWTSRADWYRFQGSGGYRAFRQSTGARLGSPLVDREYRAVGGT